LAERAAVRAAAVFLFLAAALPAAATSSIDELFHRLGLFGTWAGNCAAPASPANPHVTIHAIAPGIILEDHDLGPDNEVNRYSILSAEQLSANQIALQVIFQPGKEDEERQKLVWSVRDGTLRTLFNQPQGGPVRVKDGVAVGYGVATPVLRKCE
jgi:hypothetical protein